LIISLWIKSYFILFYPALFGTLMTSTKGYNLANTSSRDGKARKDRPK
jgi:hypothetical protein